MTRRRKRRGRIAGWAVTAVAGIGTGAAVLALLEPGRRARARGALERVREAARGASDRVSALTREAGERISAFRAELPPPGTVERRPGLLGAVLVARAVLGRGLLRIPFGLLGLSTLASSDRGRATVAAVTRGVRGVAATLRSYSKAAAGRAAGEGGGAGVVPEGSPAT